ncbi:MAG: SH3 domain-containing protein [Phaeodactylibacter sp.]|nr:SH3 domain-containing protein [Phaeodactylibacter sp.]MCB9274469.1 SH3 domain-containing protein [Lewinellaceae bacterium]
MSKKPGLLPKLEFLVIGILFFAFLIWAMSKCNATQRAYREKAAADARDEAIADSMDRVLEGYSPLDTAIKAKEITPPAATGDAARKTVLYVTVDGMNMRSGPGLNFRIVERLQLYDEVEFLGEVTDTTQEINLGQITTDEPWVKVKTRKGNAGWVYGAGVSYYKKKLEGVDTE